MKKLFYIFVLFTLCHPELVYAELSRSEGQTKVFNQKYAPKKFYLIDSLNLTSLSKEDRQLIDSCLTLYHKTKDDTIKINALSGICENMLHDDWKKYQYFQYELINKIVETHHTKLVSKHLKKSLANALNNIGYIYDKQGNTLKSLEYYNKSLQLQEEIGEKQGTATSLNNIGAIYYFQGDIPKALEYYHRSLKIVEVIGDKQTIARLLNNIGLIYQNQGDLSKALEYFNKSLIIKEESGDKQGTANLLNNIGLLYDNMGDIPKSLEYYNKGLKIQEEIRDKQGIAGSLNNIGSIYNNKGDNYNALACYNKSLIIWQEIGNKRGITVSLSNIGNIYLTQHQLKTAKSYYEKAYQLSKELGYPKNIEDAASGLKRVYEKEGNFKLAYHFYQEAILMRDSIQSEENYKASVQQRAKYEYEKKAATDSIANVKEKEIKDSEIAQQQAEIKTKRLQQYGLIGGLAIVLIFASFVYNRLKVTQQQKRIIEAQKTEVEQQKQLVEKQKEVVEEKQKEILDSIRYAKRIQDALLTSQSYIERNINRLKSTK